MVASNLLALIAWLKKHIFIVIIVILFPALLFFTNILSYVNTQLTSMKREKKLKVIAFDLDETLGYFTELSIFWEALEFFYGTNLLSDKFFQVLDIFPEFFRPDNDKKKKKACYKIFIYTNNQGPKSWVNMISEYCSKKLNSNVFDYVIAAYKVRGKQIEVNRTSHEKSVKDLIKCTGIPESSEICFIDDLYHPLMDKENVYYINIKPYRYSLPFEEMAERYYDLVISNYSYDGPAIGKQNFIKKIVDYMKQYNYMIVNKSLDEENVDKAVSKKLLSNLDEFLKRHRPMNTRKIRTRRTKTMRHNV